jgi:hypothetical protein
LFTSGERRYERDRTAAPVHTADKAASSPRAGELITRELVPADSGSPLIAGEKAGNLPDDAELSLLFEGADDKYQLVDELYRRGLSMDTLARCSGIPLGEIKLVLNLSK